MNPQNPFTEEQQDQAGKPEGAATPVSMDAGSRPSIWPLLAILMLSGVALAVLLPPQKTDTEYSSGRSKVSRVKGDQRSLTIAIETYYLDNNEYPAWSAGPGGANAFAAPQSHAYQIPTFRNRRDKNDTLATLTTPISYVSSYFSDPFADVRGATFAYWVTPKDKGTGYIVWSPGPDGIYDIVPEEDYSPLTIAPSPSLIDKTYDPSNGTSSRGDVWRVKQ